MLPNNLFPKPEKNNDSGLPQLQRDNTNSRHTLYGLHHPSAPDLFKYIRTNDPSKLN